MLRQIVFRLAAAAFMLLSLEGCADFGHAELARDQLGYSQSLSESQKEQTLLNIVRLRYGSIPVLLNATQVIAGYQLQRNASVGAEVFPATVLITFASGAAAVQLQQSPTFTFQPVNGKDFAESYVRPLSPAALYPLTIGNLPIDVLLRLTVTSIGPLHNLNVFAGRSDVTTASFFALISDLRAFSSPDPSKRSSPGRTTAETRGLRSSAIASSLFSGPRTGKSGRCSKA